MQIAGKRVVVLGLAREGVALARYLSAHGAHVAATDRGEESALGDRLTSLQDASVRVVVGGDHPELVDGADVLFVSPGVPDVNPVYAAALQQGTPVESMTTLFFDACPGPIVGITGSSGKTTTTGLVGHMARTAGLDVVVAGNIGAPMIETLETIGPQTTVVLELSSFQLELLRRSPHIAVVTNISPNHLDRHGTMESYVDAKRHIVAHQSEEDFAVLNRCDPEVSTFARTTPGDVHWFGPGSERGALTHRGTVSLVEGGRLTPVIAERDIPLLGRHNVENVLAATATAALLDIEPEAMADAVRTFRPAAHRLETVGRVRGVAYVDDSIATTPARAEVALDAIPTPVVLIAGGRDKQLPWETFARKVAQRVRVLLLIGEAAPQIETAVRGALVTAGGTLEASNIKRCSSLPDAVEEAGRVAQPGDTVLLSPACTSYDMFSNFEERGRVFAVAVEELHAA